ncbi:MAG: NADH-quinone oxidoreductase subunit N, partial [Gemmatimonadales bacterium]
MLRPPAIARGESIGVVAPSYSPREGQLMRVFFLLSALLVGLLGTISLAKQRMPRTEFYHILLVVTAAMMLLVQSNHFVMLFVALETVTIGLYI